MCGKHVFTCVPQTFPALLRAGSPVRMCIYIMCVYVCVSKYVKYVYTHTYACTHMYTHTRLRARAVLLFPSLYPFSLSPPRAAKTPPAHSGFFTGIGPTVINIHTSLSIHTPRPGPPEPGSGFKVRHHSSIFCCMHVLTRVPGPPTGVTRLGSPASPRTVPVDAAACRAYRDTQP